MSHVFISHAEEDRPTTLRLCELLDSDSIPTWVSFRDIKAGAHWDEEIEKALGTAAAVVVLVTANSVNSRYVRAEVEGALSEQLTVVPVVLGQVTMPLRWKALQFIRWSGDADVRVASEIKNALPPAAHRTFVTLLEDPTKEQELRDLILNHTEWLPIEFKMHLDYRYVQNAVTMEGNTLDCFAAREDSSGPRGYLYYLGSPFVEPFDSSGAFAASTLTLVDRIKRDVNWFANEMPDQHALAPSRFLYDRGEREPAPTTEPNDSIITDPYDPITIKALVGRRSHFQRDESNRARESMARSIEMSSPRCRLVVEIISYDRVLEAMKMESTGEAAWRRQYLRESGPREGRSS